MPAAENIPYTDPQYRDANFTNQTNELLYRLLVLFSGQPLGGQSAPRPITGDNVENDTLAIPENAVWFSVAPASSDDEFDINWNATDSTTGIKICWATPDLCTIKPAVEGQPITITARGKVHVSWMLEAESING